MGYFGGNLAREIARLTGWEDKVWSRRYESILITDEETAQVERLAEARPDHRGDCRGRP